MADESALILRFPYTIFRWMYDARKWKKFMRERERTLIRWFFETFGIMQSDIHVYICSG